MSRSYPEPPRVYTLELAECSGELSSDEIKLRSGALLAVLGLAIYRMLCSYYVQAVGLLFIVPVIGYYFHRPAVPSPDTCTARRLAGDEVGRELLKQGSELMRRRSRLLAQQREAHTSGQASELDRLLGTNTVSLHRLHGQQQEFLNAHAEPEVVQPRAS